MAAFTTTPFRGFGFSAVTLAPHSTRRIGFLNVRTQMFRYCSPNLQTQLWALCETSSVGGKSRNLVLDSKITFQAPQYSHGSQAIPLPPNAGEFTWYRTEYFFSRMVNAEIDAGMSIGPAIVNGTV